MTLSVDNPLRHAAEKGKRRAGDVGGCFLLFVKQRLEHFKYGWKDVVGEGMLDYEEREQSMEPDS